MTVPQPSRNSSHLPRVKVLTYALAIDRKARDGFGITANAYGVQGIPTVVVIGKDGKIVEMPEGVQALAKLVAKLLKP